MHEDPRSPCFDPCPGQRFALPEGNTQKVTPGSRTGTVTESICQRPWATGPSIGYAGLMQRRDVAPEIAVPGSG